ncbi:hypothetical protein B4903_17690 [Yersinia frederiksenii]|nr:hypothetical protein B4903_17690 [Yersinia frederiksenii]
MPQPPKRSQARDPFGIPTLAHVSLAHFVGGPRLIVSLTDRRDSLLLKHGSLGIHASRPISTLHSAAQMCFKRLRSTP